MRNIFDRVSTLIVTLTICFVAVHRTARGVAPPEHREIAASTAPAGAGTPLFALDASLFRASELQDAEHHPVKVGTIESAPGKFGPGLKCTFTAPQSGAFFTTRVRPTAAWDTADGFSFWVRGDGSQSCGGIEMIDADDFSLRYGYCFAIDSTDWKQVFVRWSDLIPELAGPLVGTEAGQFHPSSFGHFAFGKWFYWREYPPHAFTIDRVMLEPKITPQNLVATTAPTTSTTVASKADAGPLDRVRARLARHEPLTIVTMGDSLSDKHHWSNHQTLWSELLVKKLHENFGSQITLINPSIGGTTLSQNTILIPRWLAQAPAPDLVIIWYGGNDWNSNVRGPRFGEYLRVAIDRVRALTRGSADVLVMTTEPTFDQWETYAPLEQAEKDVAREKRAALLDIAAEFRKAGSADEALKRNDWVSDKVHLGPAGHQLVEQSVEAILSPARN